MSQLDLATTANVSARHISFLETGRAQASSEMVLKLGSALSLTLRDQNMLLKAAGHPPMFVETSAAQPFEPCIENALSRMLAQQEPYPLTITNPRYEVLRMNAAAARVMSRFVAEPAALRIPLNTLRHLFDPRAIRPFVEDWESLARRLLTRLLREALSSPGDGGLRELANELAAYPGVPSDWRTPDFSLPMTPAMPITVVRDGLRLSFLTTTTVFNAPQDITLEELRIESYFPLDVVTERACAQLAAGH